MSDVHSSTLVDNAKSFQLLAAEEVAGRCMKLAEPVLYIINVHM